MARLWTLVALVAVLTCGITGTANARPLTLTGPSSWYGGPCDKYDNNIPKWLPGDRNRTPGIALRRYDTPRRYFLLTLVKTKRKVVVRHSDYGPHGSTGKLVDVNYTAAKGLGYSGCHDDYPTWAKVRITLLTSKKSVKYWSKKTATRLDDRRIASRL